MPAPRQSSLALRRRPSIHSLRLGVVLWGVVLGFGLASDARADVRDQLFRANYEIGVYTNLQRGVNSVFDVDTLFDGSALNDLTSGNYDPLTDRVYANLNLRGVAARAGFNENDAAFFFQIEAAGIDIAFDGDSREESLDLFESWLENGLPLPDSEATALTNLLQAFVADSAVDPVAGNPFSLQSRMMQAPYDLAARAAFRPKDEFAADENGEVWTGDDVFNVRADYSPFWGGPWNGFVADLAFEYTLNLKEPRLAITFDMPIAYTQTERDAHTASAHAGIGLLYRATPWWNIYTQGRAGIAGSLQLGGLAVLYSTAVSSHMQWKIGRTTLRLGNSFSASSSIDGIEWLGYEITYAITNYLVRNGFEVEQALPLRFRQQPMFVRLDFTDNWLLGSRVFTEHYNEVGLHFGATRSLGSGAVRDRASIGLTYTGAQQYNALRVSLEYAF